ncbi:uncharacterized protein [Clytia hemisphaerica]|uniref:uncharacterized protein n=1 Tax=Clytia hemisphaerica TaxID=252671 RepID=UPI0034D58803
MKEHISFITDGMNEAIRDKVNPNTLTSVEIGSIIKSLLQNHQHRQLIELIDQIIINPSCHSNDDLFSCVLDNTNIRKKLSANTLCVLFTNNFRMFEQYLLGFIKNMFQKYPLLCRDDVRMICEQNRLFELLKHDDRFVIGFKEILKSCFYTMGSNPVLSLFMWTVIGELNLGTSEDKESFEDALLSIQETDNGRVRFEAWFQINLNFDKIEELLLTIFQVDNKQLEQNMRFLLSYFMHEMPPQPILDELLQKIKTMKRILPMKVVQITDVQPLLSSHQYTACAAILNIANVLFMGYCHGVKSFMKELVTKIVTQICKEDFEKFWFLFAMDLLAKIKTTHSELSLTVCKNQVDKYWKDMSNFKRVEMDLT